jgi:Fe-coproporphyrin III synthase
MDLAAVERLLPSLADLKTEVVLLSGGEPLLNPQWLAIAELLRRQGLRLWLLTSGLSLAKHARRVAELFAAVTVSLDGTCRETYAAIRGLDAFDKVCEGISAATAAGASVNLRITVQRANYRELPGFVHLGRVLGVRQISFLAVDVANPHAFGRAGDFTSGLALALEDLPAFEHVLGELERDQAGAFESGFIAESPQKLRRLLQYFSALHGRGAYPTVRCNAPEFSAVVEAGGQVRPCFFIPGPQASGDLRGVLDSGPMKELRADIRRGARPECATCVCPLWRDFQRGDTLLPRESLRAST